LKTWPKQLLGSPLLDIKLPASMLTLAPWAVAITNGILVQLCFFFWW